MPLASRAIRRLLAPVSAGLSSTDQRGLVEGLPPPRTHASSLSEGTTPSAQHAPDEHSKSFRLAPFACTRELTIEQRSPSPLSAPTQLLRAAIPSSSPPTHSHSHSHSHQQGAFHGAPLFAHHQPSTQSFQQFAQASHRPDLVGGQFAPFPPSQPTGGAGGFGMNGRSSPWPNGAGPGPSVNGIGGVGAGGGAAPVDTRTRTSLLPLPESALPFPAR